MRRELLHAGNEAASYTQVYQSYTIHTDHRLAGEPGNEAASYTQVCTRAIPYTQTTGHAGEPGNEAALYTQVYQSYTIHTDHRLAGEPGNEAALYTQVYQSYTIHTDHRTCRGAWE